LHGVARVQLSGCHLQAKRIICAALDTFALEHSRHQGFALPLKQVIQQFTSFDFNSIQLQQQFVK
jgi:hypothetical protein